MLVKQSEIASANCQSKSEVVGMAMIEVPLNSFTVLLLYTPFVVQLYAELWIRTRLWAHILRLRFAMIVLSVVGDDPKTLLPNKRNVWNIRGPM